MWFHSFNPRSSSSSASSSSSSSWKVSQGTCIFLQFWRPIHYDFKNSKKPFQSCWKQVGRATPIIFVQYLQLLATLNATLKDSNASSFRPHGFAGPTWLDPGDSTEITLQGSSIRPNFRDFQTWSGHFHVQADSRIRRSPYFTTGFSGGLRCGYKLSSPSARGIFHPPASGYLQNSQIKSKNLGMLVVKILEAAKVLMIKSTIFLMMPNLQV